MKTTVPMPDHDAQEMQFIDLPIDAPWTTFTSLLIHRATCEQCMRDGAPEVHLRVLIEGKPYMAVVGISLRPVQ